MIDKSAEGIILPAAFSSYINKFSFDKNAGTGDNVHEAENKRSNYEKIENYF